MKLSAVLKHFRDPVVKAGIDTLPMGICCYWPGGLVKLKNRTMEKLSFEITNEALLDGEAFWEALTSGTGNGQFIETGRTPVVRLSDGTVRGFSQQQIAMEGSALYEITASDLTEVYARNAELKEKQARVQAMVERHRALNAEIDTMIRQREVLAAKLRIHDDLSRALLSSRQYLTTHPDIQARGGVADSDTQATAPDTPAQKGDQRADAPDTNAVASGTRADLVRLWEETVRILQNAQSDIEQDDAEYMFRTASAFGMTLLVEGALPEDATARRLLTSAVVTSLSNAFRHAGAGNVRCVIAPMEDGWRVEITNDGTPPRGEVAETGGLKTLRAQVEQVGGQMTVGGRDRFVLTLILPKRITDEL